MKIYGSVLEERLSFNMLGLTFSSKLDCGFYMISIAITASRSNIPFNCRFFLNRFSVCFNLFVLLFFVTPCLIVDVQPCME